ncbi:hypothetical protein HMPREF6745_0792 [Prevotella sp. oral taxon 472 str. F0295]|nr:hypothetical protein HMPREF6745_0792 [Prevotella sp. oral taxon 472 str. F0295]
MKSSSQHLFYGIFNNNTSAFESPKISLCNAFIRKASSYCYSGELVHIRWNTVPFHLEHCSISSGTQFQHTCNNRNIHLLSINDITYRLQKVNDEKVKDGMPALKYASI